MESEHFVVARHNGATAAESAFHYFEGSFIVVNEFDDEVDFFVVENIVSAVGEVFVH
jgi:hypothetical protein